MFRYAIAGAGLQGTAAAYDLGIHGNAEKILLIDIREDVALSSAKRVNLLLGKNIVRGLALDVHNKDTLIELLLSERIQTFISAIHYELNETMTSIAIQARLNMCDLGGNTEVVHRQHKYNAEAEARNITIVPDCGMGPGLNISLGMYAMSMIDYPKELYIWDGGLPQNPQAPWNYDLTFNIRGLTNEYTGNAFYLRNSKVIEVPTLTELETLEFPETLGTLEAAVTSGGLSTAPWTLTGKLERLENKTLRYPGHWAQMQTFEKLGLFKEDAVFVNGINVIPRDLFHTLLAPQISKSKVRDVCVIRVQCIGKDTNNHREKATIELIDYYDPNTGFTAMQKLTGWHASIVAILCTESRIPHGVIPVEAISGSLIMEEVRKRGFKTSKSVVSLD